MNIEKAIHKAATKLVRVRISSKSRSTHGFDVKSNGTLLATFPSKKTAMQCLFATIRCAERMSYEIKPNKITKKDK